MGTLITFGRRSASASTIFLLILLSGWSTKTQVTASAQTLDIINTSVPEISYVMEPFEVTVEDYEWFVELSGDGDDDDNGDLNLTLTNEASLFGNASLLVEFEYVRPADLDTSTTTTTPITPIITRNGNETTITVVPVVDETKSTSAMPPRVDFGWIVPDRPHNCYGATHMSLWYKVMEQQQQMKMTLTLLDDSDCISPITGGLCTLENHTGVNGELFKPFSYSVLLPPVEPNDEPYWQELHIPVEDFVMAMSDTSDNGDKLSLNHVRGWKISLQEQADVSGTSTIDVDDQEDDTMGKIVVLVDQLACVGGGEMLGAAFHLGEDMSWDNAIKNNIWMQEYYVAKESEENSHVVMEDGRMSVDFSVAMVEPWGGFNAYTYLAPGPAYYNLTGATDWHLSFHTREAATVPGRTHLRIVIADDSHCTANCSSDVYEQERWYSFHYIFDDNVTNGGMGDIYIPLVGSLDPSTPFWLTRWSGITGDSTLDVGRMKGFTLEINIDSGGDINSTVTGAFDLFGMSALSVVYNETDSSGSGACVVEPDLYFREDYEFFQRKEFLGNRCCEVCEEDETCLYALSTGRDCFIASHMEADMVGLLYNEILQEDLTAFWMDDADRRGDFCDLCDCRSSDRTIDCRNRNLLIVPKTFYHEAEDVGWTPRVLDLRNNSKLVMLGSGSLKAVGADLEELYLPEEMRHVSMDSLKDLPKLKNLVQGDDDHSGNLTNAIMDSSEAFGDVCCSRGPSLSSVGITFCDMQVDQPGIDSVYLDHINYPYATLFKHITPSSSFMSEAAESPEKCAQYCTINEACRYFSYDQRLPNAEHTCYLLENDGLGKEQVSLQPDNFADEKQTIPGYIAGYAPSTRHEKDNARVVVGRKSLLVSPANGYEARYKLSLGSSPLRGAVWIEPRVVSETNLSVSFSPERVVFYDSDQTAMVTVRVAGVVTDANSVSLLVSNEVESCDTAFMQTSEAVANRGTTLFVDVEMPQSPEEDNIGIVLGSCFAVFGGLALIIFFYFERKRQANDNVWKVSPEELVYPDPEEVLGRGTFGLVLKATYRGTDVAVKRVIPPKEKARRTRNGSVASIEKGSRDGMGSSMGSGSGTGMTSSSVQAGTKLLSTSGSSSMQMGTQTLKWGLSSIIPGMSASAASYAKLKKDFVIEMRQLSKLRHPSITTVMGAVISSKSEPMLIMEYMGHGSLYDLLHNETMIIEGELLLPILQDISQGVRFLHAANPQVIHGDLKAANILVDEKFRAKVADFGLSQKRTVLKGATGTPFWMAPELLRQESTNTTASDVYAFGVILYEVYSRKDPYQGEEAAEVLRLVADPKVAKRPAVPLHMPAPIQSLMADCIVENPGDRPSFEELDQRLKRVDAKSVEPTHSPGAKKTANISLFDIFPRHIAEALRDGKKVEPEHRDHVTIFFSDIVGFTTISSTLDPRKVANLLDRFYHKLDDLSHKHDLYKVETIGDAYMCCGNLVKDQPDDHVKRIAEFAVDAIAAAGEVLIDEDDPDGPTVEIRVGFHTGPVVADVVGTRNPRYCLFGDTVNVASRMESTSQVGRIHCSKESANLLMVQHPTMPLTSRGETNIKGKGYMTTFWVNHVGTSGALLPPEEAPMLDVSMGHIAEERSEDFDLESAEMGRLLSTPTKSWAPEFFEDEEGFVPGSTVEC